MQSHNLKISLHKAYPILFGVIGGITGLIISIITFDLYLAKLDIKTMSSFFFMGMSFAFAVLYFLAYLLFKGPKVWWRVSLYLFLCIVLAFSFLILFGVAVGEIKSLEDLEAFFQSSFSDQSISTLILFLIISTIPIINVLLYSFLGACIGYYLCFVNYQEPLIASPFLLKCEFSVLFVLTLSFFSFKIGKKIRNKIETMIFYREIIEKWKAEGYDVYELEKKLKKKKLAEIKRVFPFYEKKIEHLKQIEEYLSKIDYFDDEVLAVKRELKDLARYEDTIRKFEKLQEKIIRYKVMLEVGSSIEKRLKKAWEKYENNDFEDAVKDAALACESVLRQMCRNHGINENLTFTKKLKYLEQFIEKEYGENTLRDLYFIGMWRNKVVHVPVVTPPKHIAYEVLIRASKFIQLFKNRLRI